MTFSSLASHSPNYGSPPSQSPPASPPVDIPQPQQTSDRHTQEQSLLSSYCVIPSITSHSANAFYIDDHDRLQNGGDADVTSVGIASVDEKHESAEGGEASSEELKKGEDDDKKNRDSGALSADAGSISAASRAEENVETDNLEQTVAGIYYSVQETSAGGVPGKTSAVVAARYTSFSSISKLKKKKIWETLNNQHSFPVCVCVKYLKFLCQPFFHFLL